MTSTRSVSSPIRRLNRVEQLTLNSWRLAAAKVARVVDPFAILEHAALHTVISALREVDQPLALFDHHAAADAELALISSLIGPAGRADLAYDILDAAYLVRWSELVVCGKGPEELPPLRPAPTVGNRALI
jgi:hypothetical protein